MSSGLISGALHRRVSVIGRPNVGAAKLRRPVQQRRSMIVASSRSSFPTRPTTSRTAPGSKSCRGIMTLAVKAADDADGVRSGSVGGCSIETKRPNRLHRPGVLRRAPQPFWSKWRFRPGVCHRARDWPSRPAPARDRHPASAIRGDENANQFSSSSGADLFCWSLAHLRGIGGTSRRRDIEGGALQVGDRRRQHSAADDRRRAAGIVHPRLGRA